MHLNFQFKTPESSSDIRNLIDFLALQPLTYPDYAKWVQKAEAELFAEQKQAIMALSDNRLVGDIVFQQHKQLPRVRELRNLRVHPVLRGRYFGSFLLKQAEQGLGKDFDLIMCDARSDQHNMTALLLRSGYTPITTVNLYDNTYQDTIFTKAA